MSTDKSVNPANVMGASKRLAERACQGRVEALFHWPERPAGGVDDEPERESMRWAAEYRPCGAADDPLRLSAGSSKSA